MASASHEKDISQKTDISGIDNQQSTIMSEDEEEDEQITYIEEQKKQAAQDAADIVSLKTKQNAEVEDLQKKEKDLIRKVPKTQRARIQSIHQKYNKLINEIKTRHAQELQDMRETHDTRLAEAAAAAEAKRLAEKLERAKAKPNAVTHAYLARVVPPTTLSRYSLIDDNSDSVTQIRRAQRQLKRRARESRQLGAKILASLPEGYNLPKNAEMRALQQKLKKHELEIYDIPSNADCVYNAIRHQLMQAGLGGPSVDRLRAETGNYLEMHKDALIDDMKDPKTGEQLDEDDFLRHCDGIRKKSAWAGHIELKVLSFVLRRPIEVVEAECANFVAGEDEFGGPHLILTHHQHLYKNTEHYNSTTPVEKEMVSDEKEDSYINANFNEFDD